MAKGGHIKNPQDKWSEPSLICIEEEKNLYLGPIEPTGPPPALRCEDDFALWSDPIFLFDDGIELPCYPYDFHLDPGGVIDLRPTGPYVITASPKPHPVLYCDDKRGPWGLHLDPRFPEPVKRKLSLDPERPEGPVGFKPICDHEWSDLYLIPDSPGIPELNLGPQPVPPPPYDLHLPPPRPMGLRLEPKDPPIPESWHRKVFLDKKWPSPRPSPNESICYVPNPMDKLPQDDPEKGF